MTSTSRRTRAALAGLALLGLTATTALQQLPATAAEQKSVATSLADPDSFVTLGDTVAGLADVTAPLVASGTSKGDLLRFAPTAGQLAAAAKLPASTTLRWNDAGTPASILPASGALMAATGRGAEATAKQWIADNQALLGINGHQVETLELVSDQPLAGSGARAVLFRQVFGGLSAATGSMVTVGISDAGDVAYVSSSLVRADAAPVAAALTPLQGWLAAATAVGRTGIPASSITLGKTIPGQDWTRLSVPGYAQAQLSRLRAFATSDGTVRPVFEANVVDDSAGTSFAYRVLVDAVSGAMLFRQNAVENSSNAFQFQGTYTPTTCGQVHPFTLTDANTKSIAAVAVAVVATDDIIIKLSGPGGTALVTGDTATSPEVATYSPGTTLPQGIYGAQVCAFGPSSMTPTVGGPYSLNVVSSDQGVGTGSVPGLPQPKWRAFAANPTLSSVAQGTKPTNTVIECWFASTPGCATNESHQNIAAFGPWDQLSGVPTLTTVGNNANTHEAWLNPLAPGGLFQAPVSPTRDYTDAFTDVWNETKCDTANLVPGGNDILPVTTNLFTGHNRIHDFAYYLGFTEKNYNLQVDNSGRGGRGADPEIGNVQAGAITGGMVGQYMGRDNANQIALQDGVPGITNQYLFQPIAAAFYSPCTDGALDTGIYGHEYTHAISNRMVGGPDDGLTSEQGGAMGESWSDLNASEYQFENDYLSNPAVAKNPWSLGSYTTGNFDKGIRDYALNDNPLNYSDYGFDTTGAEVHADGEIWNGTQWEVRQALADKWNSQFSYTDKALQERCEQATASATPLDASACPGNRRWIQLIFDSFLLQQGNTSMLDARDAMLAADRMRFGGANQAVMNAAFARRGMGAGAVTTAPASGGEDTTVASFRSATGNNSAVTFAPTVGGSRGWQVFVGDYEARATPVATSASPTAPFTPGIYRLTYVSATQGFRRFVMTVADNGAAVTQPIDDAAANLAAAANGAKVIASNTAAGLNEASLIDGTEATNWSGEAGAVNIDDATVKPSVSVGLAGGTVQTISSAKVSALLSPPPAAADPTGLGIPARAAEDDPLSGSRFTALRKFALEACTADCASTTATWKRFFTSADDAFPGTIPRPVAPDQTMRSFTFAPVQASAVRLVALENQCTGQAAYAGQQIAAPAAVENTDCKTGSTRGQVVHAAELQVFGGTLPADPAPGTPGTGVPGSGDAGQGTSALPAPGQGVIPGAVSTAKAPTATAPGRVRVTTRTRIRLPRVQQVRGRESTPLMFSVVAPTTSLGRKAGKVVIKIDGKKVRKTFGIQVTRKAGKKVVGKTFNIPTSLAYGPHRIQVFFKTFDAASFTASKSRKITLTVVRSRPRA